MTLKSPHPTDGSDGYRDGVGRAPSSPNARSPGQDPVRTRSSPQARSSGRPLGVARQPVVRDRLPRRGVCNELPEFGSNYWITIDGTQPHPRLGVICWIAGEDG